LGVPQAAIRSSQGFVEGIHFSVTTPDAALVLVLLAALGTFGYNFVFILPIIDRCVVHATSVVFGLLNVAIGTGSLVASLYLAYSHDQAVVGSTGSPQRRPPRLLRIARR
jgi:hypothetical protein